MFSNLIESGSHAADLKRKGRFFLGTIAFHCLLLVATGVGSIYAYNAKLDEPTDLEVLALMHFPPAEPRTEPTSREAPRPASGNTHEVQIAMRAGAIAVQNPNLSQIAPPNTKDIDSHTPVVLGPVNIDPTNFGGPAGPGVPGSTANNNDSDIGPTVRIAETAPPPRAVTTPTPERPTGPVRLTSEIISSKALSKPPPPYPLIAKQAHIQGPVAVQIVIDEQGRVVSARATSGNGLLQAAAVQAAYQARFTPTLLGGQAVKVTGSITYNFVLN